MCVTFDRAGPDEILWAHDQELRGIHLMYSYKLMKKKRSGIKSFKPQVRFLGQSLNLAIKFESMYLGLGSWSASREAKATS